MDTLLLLSSLLAQAADSTTTHVIAGTVEFTDMLVRYDTLMITGAAWAIIQAVQKGFPKLADHAIAQRLKPGASIVLCTALAYLPQWQVGSWDETLLYGIVIGGSLGQGHKILSQTVFGKDRRIKPYVEDPELRKIIDEYVAAKESGDRVAKKSALDHLKHWLT